MDRQDSGSWGAAANSINNSASSHGQHSPRATAATLRHAAQLPINRTSSGASTANISISSSHAAAGHGSSIASPAKHLSPRQPRSSGLGRVTGTAAAAAGATAAVTVSLSRALGLKPSGTAAAAAAAGSNSRHKGHHPAHHSHHPWPFLRGRAGRLLAVGLLLLLLPLGLLLQMQLKRGSSSSGSVSSFSAAAAYRASHGSSSSSETSSSDSSSSDSNNPGSSVSSLKGDDGTSSSSSSSSSSDGGSSSSDSGSSSSEPDSDQQQQPLPDAAAAAEEAALAVSDTHFHCISPSRSLPWHEVDAELQQDAASSPAAATQHKQQQQQPGLTLQEQLQQDLDSLQRQAQRQQRFDWGPLANLNKEGHRRLAAAEIAGHTAAAPAGRTAVDAAATAASPVAGTTAAAAVASAAAAPGANAGSAGSAAAVAASGSDYFYYDSDAAAAAADYVTLAAGERRAAPGPAADSVTTQPAAADTTAAAAAASNSSTAQQQQQQQQQGEGQPTPTPAAAQADDEQHQYYYDAEAAAEAESPVPAQEQQPMQPQQQAGAAAGAAVSPAAAGTDTPAAASPSPSSSTAASSSEASPAPAAAGTTGSTTPAAVGGSATGSSAGNASSSSSPAAATAVPGSTPPQPQQPQQPSPTGAAATGVPVAANAAANVAAGAGVDSLDIALVNDVEFHHEVTLGLMAALQKHKARLKVYVHDSMFKPPRSGSSSFNFLKYVQSVMPGNTLRNAYYKPGITKTDVAIFVSPEFSIDYYREFIRRATPRMLIIFIHEPDMELRRLQYIINMHPLVAVAALSPHVADTVRSRMRMHHVQWMMPVLPVTCNNNCWEGFAVQGKFEGSRRNYGGLWSAMQSRLHQHLQQAEVQLGLNPEASAAAATATGAAAPAADSAAAGTATATGAAGSQGDGAARALLSLAATATPREGQKQQQQQQAEKEVQHVASRRLVRQLRTQQQGLGSESFLAGHSISRPGWLLDATGDEADHKAAAAAAAEAAEAAAVVAAAMPMPAAATAHSAAAVSLVQGATISSRRSSRMLAAEEAAAGGSDALVPEQTLAEADTPGAAAAGPDLAGSTASLPRINVMGSGRLALLGLPQELRPWVFLYRGLGYEDYYDTLCRSVALLPLFNSSSGYLDKKISSSVLTSVAVGVPMIVPPRFLTTYAALKADHVFLLPEGDDVGLGVMELLASPAASAGLASRRRSLAQLRFVLLHQATAKLEGLMAAAHGRPHATTKQD